MVPAEGWEDLYVCARCGRMPNNTPLPLSTEIPISSVSTRGAKIKNKLRKSIITYEIYRICMLYRRVILLLLAVGPTRDRTIRPTHDRTVITFGNLTGSGLPEEYVRAHPEKFPLSGLLPTPH
jgi:hypothetical protein